MPVEQFEVDISAPGRGLRVTTQNALQTIADGHMEKMGLIAKGWTVVEHIIVTVMNDGRKGNMYVMQPPS